MVNRRSSSGGRALPAAGVACALALALTACGADRSTPAAAPSASTSRPDHTGSAPSPSGPSGVGAPTPPASAAAPITLTIPTLGIRSSLVQLGLTRDGTLSVPVDFGQAGWYSGGPRPGDQGPAVIAGHVDSKSGPAIFYRLRELRAGDPVRLQRRDGTEVTFTVTGLRQYPKNAFPTAAVYGPVPQPELRLITCSGTFDEQRSSYRSNLVVSAVLTSPVPSIVRAGQQQ